MDDISEKLQSLLSDEEGLKKLQFLYEILSGSEKKGEKEASDTPEPTDEAKESEACCEGEVQDSGFDFSTLFKLQGLFDAAGSGDSGTALIMSLKPFLSRERQERADKASRLLGMLNALTVLKESGLLNDLL